MPLIVGVDPGLSGALAFLDPGAATIEVRAMPTLMLRKGTGKAQKRALDMAAIARLCRERDGLVSHVIVEDVHALPGQGVTSMFQFGRSLGQVEGVFAALDWPITYVSPVTWKKQLQVPAQKDAARGRASQLLPGCASLWPLVKDDGKAEASLLALYLSRTLGLGATARYVPLGTAPSSTPQGAPASAAAAPVASLSQSVQDILAALA